jgi:hypothetical protein
MFTTVSRPKATIVRLTVSTESGAVYTIRGFGDRAYVTRVGSARIYGSAPINALTKDPIHLIKGEPMRATFNGKPLRTTPVVSIEYTVEQYPA